MLKVLIVDDEPLAREGLRLHLQAMDNLNVIGECSNGSEAISAITTKNPDLVFLDIQMPRINGFDVIEAVGAEQMPPVIFLTAYNEHAVSAFEVQALDYLLKPLDPVRLASSIERAQEEILKHKLTDRAQQFKDLLNSDFLAKNKERESRVVVRSAGHVYFIQPAEILWIEANGDYVALHTKGLHTSDAKENNKTHLLRDTMANMEKRLLAHGFKRIHRSSIVNLAYITELIANDSGDYQVILNNGQSLKLSRSYRDELYSALNAT